MRGLGNKKSTETVGDAQSVRETRGKGDTFILTLVIFLKIIITKND